MKKLGIIIVTLAILTPSINLSADSGDAALGMFGGMAVANMMHASSRSSGDSGVRQDVNNVINNVNNLNNDYIQTKNQTATEINNLKIEMANLKKEIETLKNELNQLKSKEPRS